MENNAKSIANPQLFLKTNQVIHGALLVGQLLFGIATLFITNGARLNLKPGDDVFFYVVPFMIIGGMIAGSFLYRRQLNQMDKNAQLKQKLSVYQTAFIIRCAPSEGASLFGVVICMQTNNLFYLVLVGLNVIYFVWIQPSKEKIEEDLKLSDDDKIALAW
jgi:hypothetical protein